MSEINTEEVIKALNEVKDKNKELQDLLVTQQNNYNEIEKNIKLAESEKEKAANTILGIKGIIDGMNFSINKLETVQGFKVEEKVEEDSSPKTVKKGK